MAEEMISLSARLAQLARDKADAPAVSSGEETLTYGQFHRRTNRLARGLQAMGVKHGDLVTLGLPNGIGFVEACWALWKVGATPQPVSFRLPKAELEAIMELARTPIVIAAFDHQIDKPLVNIADIAALADDESDMPDVIALHRPAQADPGGPARGDGGGNSGGRGLAVAGRVRRPAASAALSQRRLRHDDVGHKHRRPHRGDAQV